MTAMPVQQRMTAEEFLAIPEGEGPRWQELVDGEVIVNEPNAVHNRVQGNLYHALRLWMSAGPGRGQVYTPIDVLIDESNVFAPDLCWYEPGSGMDVSAPAPYGRPDLAVEIPSSSTWRYDVGAKKSAYERRRLPELWLVDTPAREVLVFRRSTPASARFDLSQELAPGTVLESPLLPAFGLELGELFDLS